MRFLHLADLHIGKVLNNYNLIEDQKYVLKGIIKRFKEPDIDGCVIAGDVYDTSRPSNQAIDTLDWFLSEMAEAKKPIFICAGNHDSANQLAYGSVIFAKQNIHISPVYDGEIKPVVVQDQYGSVNFWLIPFIKKAHVIEAHPDESIQSIQDAMKVLVKSLDMDADERNVAVVHQFVMGSSEQVLTDGSETINVGTIEGISYQVFASFDYVALGHIHKAQEVGRSTCRYPGSLLQYAFPANGKPENAKRSYLVVDMGPKGEVEIETEEYDVLHPMVDVAGYINDLIAPEILEDQVPNAYFRITIKDDDPTPQELASLRRNYKNIMETRMDNARTRAQGALSQPMEMEKEKSLLEHFKDFYFKQTDMELTEEQMKLVADAMEEARE